MTASGYQVLSSREIYQGRIFRMRSDDLGMPDGTSAVREVVEALGAVAIVALDDEGRVTLIRQYRHPVGDYLWEVPAGLLDVVGEPALQTAQRELHEEAHLRASTWHVMLDLYPTPGMTDEAVRVYLARDLRPVPEAERHQARFEESDLTIERVDLDEAVARSLAGTIHNGATVAGLLAASHSRQRGWTGLRPPDSPWAARPGRV